MSEGLDRWFVEEPVQNRGGGYDSMGKVGYSDFQGEKFLISSFGKFCFSYEDFENDQVRNKDKY